MAAMVNLTQSLIMIVTVTICFIPNPACGEINQRKISSTTSPSASIDENRGSSLVFIDYLGFRKTRGRIELNVSDIQFSNPNSNLNMSNIGFFITRYVRDFNYSTPPCALHSNPNWAQTLYTLDNLQAEANKFDVFYQGFEHVSDEYNLYFQHCLDDNYNVTHTEEEEISMNVRTSMYNLLDGNRCFLSANRVESLYMLYPLLIFVYFSLAFFWLCKYGLCSSSTKHEQAAPVRREIHLAFVAALILKPWAFISFVLHEFYICYTGCSQCWPSNLLTFASDFLSTAPITVFIVLLCTGAYSVKPHLLPADKGAIAFVILANVVLNVIKIVIDQVPHHSHCSDCGYTLMLADVVYYLPIAVALISSTNFLRVNEKPSVIVKYMLLFRSLLIGYHLHFTMEVVILFPMGLVVSQHSLASVLIKALLDLFLYVYLGYQIRPEFHKEKLLPYNEDAEMEASSFLRSYDSDKFILFWLALVDYKGRILR